MRIGMRTGMRPAARSAAGGWRLNLRTLMGALTVACLAL